MALELRYKSEHMQRGNGDSANWWTGLEDDGGSWETGMGPDYDDDSDADSRESGASSPGEKDGKNPKKNNADNSSPSPTNATADFTTEMDYTCLPSVGQPLASDCEHLSWSGLKPPDAVETLTPGTPNIYTSGTCALGISSDKATTISWANLLAAFNTLNNLCVQHPLGGMGKGGGGIAEWSGERGAGAVAGLGDLNGRRKGKRGGSQMTGRPAAGMVWGYDALPPGINATVWRHDDAVSPSGARGLQCEWRQAMVGGLMGVCIGV